MSFKSKQLREKLAVVAVFGVLTVVGVALAAAPLWSTNKAKNLAAADVLNIVYSTGTDKSAVVAAFPTGKALKAIRIDEPTFELDPRPARTGGTGTYALGNAGLIHVETNSAKWDLVVSAKNGGRLVRPLMAGETQGDLPFGALDSYDCARYDTTWITIGPISVVGPITCSVWDTVKVARLPGKYLMMDNSGTATPALLEFGIGTVAADFSGLLANIANVTNGSLMAKPELAESFVPIVFDPATAAGLEKISLAEAFHDSIWDGATGATEAEIQNLSALGVITSNSATMNARVGYLDMGSSNSGLKRGFPKIQARGNFAAGGGIVSTPNTNTTASATITDYFVGAYSYTGVTPVDPTNPGSGNLNGMLFYVNAKLIDDILDETTPLIEDENDDGKVEYSETLTFTFWCAD